MSKDGWKCPACGRCYAPFVQECRSCNSAIGVRRSLGARIGFTQMACYVPGCANPGVNLIGIGQYACMDHDPNITRADSEGALYSVEPWATPSKTDT